MSCKGLGLREGEELCVSSFHYAGNECWSSSTGVFSCNNSLETSYLFFLQFSYMYDQNELKISVKDVVMGDAHLGSLGTYPHCSVKSWSGVPSFHKCFCQLLWKIPQNYQTYSYFLSVLRDMHRAYKACISAFSYPPKCPVTHDKQLAPLQDQSHSLVTGTVHCHKFWVPCCFTPPFTCKRTSHIDWQDKEWEKGNIVPVFLGGPIIQTSSSMHLRLFEDSVASSELLWSECDTITPLLSTQLGQSWCWCDRGNCAPTL